MRKLFFMLSAAVVTILAGCAGSASVGVGVGVGIPRPYPGPPGATIWIGRPTPQTLYDRLPGQHDWRFVQLDRIRDEIPLPN